MEVGSKRERAKYILFFFFFKQKTAYEMRISDWSSDVCSSDLRAMTEQSSDQKKLRPLILHVEVEGFYADDLDEMAGHVREEGTVTPEDRLYVVTEEWMRQEVGITLVSLPGEKCLSAVFMVKAFNGRSEERRVGNEFVSTCRTRGSPYL